MWASAFQQVLSFSELLGAAAKLGVLQFSGRQKGLWDHIKQHLLRQVESTFARRDKTAFVGWGDAGDPSRRLACPYLVQTQAVSFFAAHRVLPSPERWHDKGFGMCHVKSSVLGTGQHHSQYSQRGILAMTQILHSAGRCSVPHTLLFPP